MAAVSSKTGTNMSKSSDMDEEEHDKTITEEFDTFRNLLRETIHGYVFWCLLQSLAPMIWFYPLNDLEISGYEAFAGLWFLQLVTGFPAVLKLVQKRNVLTGLRLIMVASLASFQAPSTLTRLVTLAFGNGIAMITLTATLWSPSKRIRCLTCWGLVLGLMLFVSSRVWLVSFVPTWWSNQTNSIVIAIAMIAVVDQYISGSDAVQDHEVTTVEVSQPPFLPTALGFAALLYVTNWCFGEVSLITRWVATGYPHHGPDPFPWGIGTLLALGFGVYMSACRHMAESKLWWLIGAIAFGVLYYLPTYQAYYGGLMLAVYTMSIWPTMLDRVSRCPPARTLAVTLVFFLVFNFFLVWTTAYNFVPGGVYTREHTDYLIAMLVVSIFLGLFTKGNADAEHHTAYIRFKKNKKMPTDNVNTLLLIILCLGLLGFGMRYNPARHNHPEKVSPKRVTSAIWTYHFGYDNKGWPSLERTASLLKDIDADVITMLESDASKPFLGNNDLGMWLGEKLGLYVDFGPSTRDHTWGNLLLSKYPIVKSRHHLMPSPDGELAPAVSATVNMSGSLVDFVVTHMGNDQDRLDRKLQADFLASELKNSENPVIFMGYVTSRPGSSEYNQLIQDGNMKDIDASDRSRFCEYILYRGLRRLGYARITHGGLSDTEVQVGRFEIPDDPHDYEDNVRLIFDPEDIPADVHFPERFGTLHHGHGWFSDHRFHMSTPKYFLP